MLNMQIIFPYCFVNVKLLSIAVGRVFSAHIVWIISCNANSIPYKGINYINVIVSKFGNINLVSEINSEKYQ